MENNKIKRGLPRRTDKFQRTKNANAFYRVNRNHGGSLKQTKYRKRKNMKNTFNPF